MVERGGEYMHSIHVPEKAVLKVLQFLGRKVAEFKEMLYGKDVGGFVLVLEMLDNP